MSVFKSSDPDPALHGAAKAWLFALILGVVALLIFDCAAWADDYQCWRESGCEALLSTEEGTKKHSFKKGDIICTSNGWIIIPGGWRKISAPCGADFYASGSGIGSGPGVAVRTLPPVHPSEAARFERWSWGEGWARREIWRMGSDYRLLLVSDSVFVWVRPAGPQDKMVSPMPGPPPKPRRLIPREGEWLYLWDSDCHVSP